MAPLRPPTPSDGSDSDSDNDAPQAVTLTQAKHAVKTQEEARERAARGVKEKTKERNRARDRALKERKGKRVAKEAYEEVDAAGDSDSGEGDEEEMGEGDADAEARMERAMREAADEDSDIADPEEGDSDIADPEDDEDVDMPGEDEEEDAGSGEEDSDDEDEDEDGLDSIPKHLPDHLFSSAAFLAPSKSKTKATKPTPKPKKRKRSARAKELVVGSRTIRVDPAASSSVAPPTPRGILPSAKVRKFTNRALALTGPGAAAAKARGWQRLPANIGVLRPRHRSSNAYAPAVGFVRVANP